MPGQCPVQTGEIGRKGTFPQMSQKPVVKKGMYSSIDLLYFLLNKKTRQKRHWYGCVSLKRKSEGGTHFGYLVDLMTDICSVTNQSYHKTNGST